MGTDLDQGDAPQGAPASVITVIVTMTAVAIFSVTAVVAWARLGPGGAASQADDRVLDEGGVPDTLDGGLETGDVPDAVVAAVDEPVVGTRLLDHLPDGAQDACADAGMGEFDEEPQLERALATTDGLSFSLVGPSSAMGPNIGAAPGQPAELRVRCGVTFDGSRWESTHIGLEPVDSEMHEGGSSFSCCDEQGRGTASAVVPADPEVSWVLQDRGGWYLAYPVEGANGVEVTWKFRENRFGGGGPPQSRVLLVDDAGTVVGETTAGDHF